MYYDDEGRRFNLVSGLLFGGLLGAGLTLLLVPQKGRGPRLTRGRGGTLLWPKKKMRARIAGALASALEDALERVGSR